MCVRVAVTMVRYVFNTLMLRFVLFCSVLFCAVLSAMFVWVSMFYFSPSSQSIFFARIQIAHIHKTHSKKNQHRDPIHSVRFCTIKSFASPFCLADMQKHEVVLLFPALSEWCTLFSRSFSLFANFEHISQIHFLILFRFILFRIYLLADKCFYAIVFLSFFHSFLVYIYHLLLIYFIWNACVSLCLSVCLFRFAFFPCAHSGQKCHTFITLPLED